MELNFKTFGEGEPVIILHGLFGMLDNWQTFGKKLAEQYQVFLVDQRDHGKSPHTDDFNYKLLADDLKAFIDHQELKNVKLIGHSMGGKTVMQFALDYSELIDKMIVVDIGVKQYKGGHEKIIAALQSVPVETISSRSEVDEILSKTIDEQGVRLFLMKNLTRNPEGGYQWKMNLDLLDKNYTEIMGWNLLDSYSQVPALFVRGGKSSYILDKDHTGIFNVFPNADIQTVDDAGHWIHAEKPVELLNIVLAYFDSDPNN